MARFLARYGGALLLGVLAAIGATACSTEAPPPPSDADVLTARIQGEWRIALSPDQRRQAELMQFLLRDPPPSNEEVESLNLTESEGKAVVLILNEIRYDPTGERTAQLRSAIAGLESGALSIGPDRLEVRLGDVRKAGQYTVVSSTASEAHLRLSRDDGEEESVALELTPDGELHFGEESDRITFVRQ